MSASSTPPRGPSAAERVAAARAKSNAPLPELAKARTERGAASAEGAVRTKARKDINQRMAELAGQVGGGREGDEDAEAGPGGSRRVLPAEMLTRAHSARLDMGPAADKYIVTKSGNSIVEAARRKVMIDKFNEGAVGLSDELKKMCNMCHVDHPDLSKLRMQFLELEFDHANGSVELEEISKTMAAFNKHVSEIGMIRIKELCEDLLDVKFTDFTMMLTTQLSGAVRGDGRLTFPQYLNLVLKLCVISKMELYRMLFNAFDLDGGGTISEDEFMEMVRILNSAGASFDGNFQRALTQFDINHDSVIDFTEFITMANKFPMLLWPAFEFQSHLREATLGTERWEDIYRSLQHSRYLEEYMRMHGTMPPEESKFRDTIMGLRAMLCGCCERVQVTDDAGVVVHPPSKDEEEDMLRKIVEVQDSLQDDVRYASREQVAAYMADKNKGMLEAADIKQYEVAPHLREKVSDGKPVRPLTTKKGGMGARAVAWEASRAAFRRTQDAPPLRE